jgi:hypothetical protein
MARAKLQFTPYPPIPAWNAAEPGNYYAWRWQRVAQWIEATWKNALSPIYFTYGAHKPSSYQAIEMQRKQQKHCPLKISKKTEKNSATSRKFFSSHRKIATVGQKF